MELDYLLLNSLSKTITLLHYDEASCIKLSKDKVYLYVWSLLCDKEPNNIEMKLPKPFSPYIVLAYHLLFYKGLSRAGLLISKLNEVEGEMKKDEKDAFMIIKIAYDTKEKGKEQVNELTNILTEEKWMYFLKKIVEMRLSNTISYDFENLVKELKNEMKPYEVITDMEVAEGYNIFETPSETVNNLIGNNRNW